METKTILKAFQHGILTAPEAKDALKDRLEDGDISNADYVAAVKLVEECEQCEDE